MAIQPRNLVTDNGAFPVNLRAISEATIRGTFASGSGTLEALTPLAFNTSTNKWVVWTNGGGNGTGTILGFVWPDPVELSAAGEVIGQIMAKGRISYHDIVLPYGEAESDLKTALRNGLVAKGLIIEDLEGIH